MILLHTRFSWFTRCTTTSCSSSRQNNIPDSPHHLSRPTNCNWSPKSSLSLYQLADWRTGKAMMCQMWALQRRRHQVLSSDFGLRFSSLGSGIGHCPNHSYSYSVPIQTMVWHVHAHRNMCPVGFFSLFWRFDYLEGLAVVAAQTRPVVKLVLALMLMLPTHLDFHFPYFASLLLLVLGAQHHQNQDYNY